MILLACALQVRCQLADRTFGAQHFFGRSDGAVLRATFAMEERFAFFMRLRGLHVGFEV